MKVATLAALSLAFAAAACSTDKTKSADTLVAASDTGMTADNATATPASTTPAGNATTSGMIDPNAAAEGDLTSAPGVTAAVASAIVAGRPYKSMPDVDKVLAKSLNEKQRDSVYTRMWIPIDLNSATKDEILLIPGVGPRMLHEFQEYRPYKEIGTFRREIGKYVDKAEVARLEQYVTIK